MVGECFGEYLSPQNAINETSHRRVNLVRVCVSQSERCSSLSN